TSVNYLVGSDEAPRGFPGTAHAEEHMMFRGSPGLTADQLADIGSIVGGNFNANTREGLTQYLFTVPSEDLDVALHIEALRLRAVLDSPEVKRLFGDIAPKKLPAKPRVRLRPVHPTSFALDTDRPSGTLMIALRTPGPRDADFAALEVLSDVLSSRRFDLYGLVPAGKAL